MEKSGIARAGKPIVIFEDFPDKALAYLTGLGAELHYPQRISALEEAVDQRQLSTQTLAQLTALRSLLPWQIDDQQIIASMRKLQIPARKQYFHIHHRTWLLDTAHNPSASQGLKDYVQRYFPGKTIYLIFACLADKDMNQMVDGWSDVAKRWYLIDLETHHRAIARTELLSYFTEKKLPFSLTNFS